MAASTTKFANGVRPDLRWTDPLLMSRHAVAVAILLLIVGCRDAGDELASEPTTSGTIDSGGSAESITVDSRQVSVADEGSNDPASTDGVTTTTNADTTSPTMAPSESASSPSPSAEATSSTVSLSTTSKMTAPAAPDRPPGQVLPVGNVDYQIGGSYPLPEGVSIVLRDRTDSPAAGAYNVCYINGFQTQPSETSGWSKDLLLQDGNGNVIIDPDWNEALLDITTPEKRKGIAEIVGGWINDCAKKGFDGVEIDNLDTYSRSGGRISQDNAVAMMATYSSLAHAAGMDIAQKNSAEIVNRASELGTDFAVVEGCSRYNECSVFTAAYGSDVIMIEYRDSDFNRGCGTHGDTNPIVLRDRNVSKPGSNAYVFGLCP